jgi:HEAT repeat protein
VLSRIAPLLSGLLLILLSPGARAEKETNPQVIEDEVNRIIEEYEAIKSNQDLEQARRRRLLADRLSGLPCEKSRKLLVKMVEYDRDLRAKITAMNSLAVVGDLDSIKRMHRYILKEQRTVLPDYLGPALSRATDPEVGPWIVKKVLPHPNKIMKLSAIEALGALRSKEALEPLLAYYEKEVKRTRPSIHLFFELIRALGRIGGEGVKEALCASAKDEDWRVRLAVAEVLLIHHREGRSLDVMRDLLRDEKPIVREVAAVSVGENRVEALFPELIVVMREGNLRSKHKSYEAMKRLSSKDYGYAPDAWAKWWSDKKKGKLDAEGGIRPEERMSVASYYKFKVFSDRILFVIDVSGSMKDPEFHPNRIEVAHRELKKTILALNEKTLFNVMTFAGNVFIWQKKGEVPATEANKKKALAWVQMRLMPRGGTNTYDALMRSLSDNPLVDTVFFLSDGLPSRGIYELPEEILIKLRYANRFRKVIFNTVALAIGRPSIEKALKWEDPDEMARFMKMIAEENGGTCVDIRKPFLDR